MEANRLQEELDTFLRGEASVGLNSARAKLGTGFPLDSDKFSKLRTEFEKFKTEFGIISLQNGGPLAAGQLALVGEAGPELFVPGTAGNVLKNEDTMAVLAAAGARALQEGTADLGAFGSAVGGAVAAGAGLFGALFGLDEDGKPLTPEGILEKAAAVREGLAEQKALLAA